MTNDNAVSMAESLEQHAKDEHLYVRLAVDLSHHPDTAIIQFDHLK